MKMKPPGSAKAVGRSLSMASSESGAVDSEPPPRASRQSHPATPAWSDPNHGAFIVENHRGHVASDGLLGANAVRLVAGDGRPHSAGLTNLQSSAIRPSL